MYLHIGKSCVIKENSVIGIFNLRRIKNSQEYKNMYEDLKEKDNIILLSSNQEKTFILTNTVDCTKGYVSNIGANIINKHRI